MKTAVNNSQTRTKKSKAQAEHTEVNKRMKKSNEVTSRNMWKTKQRQEKKLQQKDISDNYMRKAPNCITRQAITCNPQSQRRRTSKNN
ncbi:unnamed protein product [Schistosoma margrebowiei]|uniref:Uncharacterized protein n=1 Tax=Schistosoma margrebowiei TaxID=48269 RepID=A0A183N2R9_9TREM|nr:unnamed protein product [Schistosoma margrebowiei]